jgi:7-keto-8-aminopelargonate synthetase-like enzyme
MYRYFMEESLILLYFAVHTARWGRPQLRRSAAAPAAGPAMEPRGQARIRVQISAGHTPEQIKKAVTAFIKVGRKHRVID